jgi:PAS domain S-box-containing protein
MLPTELVAELPVAAAWLTWPDLTLGFANEHYRRLIGDIAGRGEPLEHVLPAMIGQDRPGRLRAVLSSGEPAWERGVPARPLDHASRPGQVRADVFCQPLRDAGGAVTGVLLLATEVMGEYRDQPDSRALSSELQAAELQAAEDRYRALFHTLPLGVIHYSADGLILEANAAAAEILGIDPEAMLTWPLVPASAAIRPDGTPLPHNESPVVVALRTGQRVSGAVIGVRHAQTGELRWLEITTVPDQPDAAGRPQRAYSVLRDVTAHRQMEAALRDGAQLMGLLSDSDVLGMAIAEEGRLIEANDTFLDLIGYRRPDMGAAGISLEAVTSAPWNGVTQDALAQLRSTGVCQPFEKECLHRDGHRVPVLIGAVAIGRDPLRWVSYVIDLTARQRVQAEQARLRDQSREAQAAAAQAQERLSFLAQAGDLVAAAQDPQDFLRCAAELVTRNLGDFCVVFLPGAQATLTAACLAYREPGGAVTVTDLPGCQLPQAGRLAVQTAWATRASTLVHQARIQVAGQADATCSLGPVLARLRPDCLLATPLISGPDPVGVIAVGRAAGQPCLSEALDVPVMDELARQVAAGVARMTRHARDHTVAETLQRAMLPGSLPDVGGLELAVRYLPATEGIDVGGDWYDAFALGDGRVGLAVGDAVGHNIAAATVMSQVRTMLRAYAVDRDDPAAVMTATSHALARLLPDALATAVYAVLDLPARRLYYATAGHLPPAYVTPAGQVSYLRAAGTMLGVPGPVSYVTGSRRLAPGSRLLFYTDGLIEDRRRDLGAGLSALSRAMRASRDCDAAQTCTAVQAALVPHAPRADDICLLAARLTSQPPA